jgi:hypothetical protein
MLRNFKNIIKLLIILLITSSTMVYAVGEPTSAKKNNLSLTYTPVLKSNHQKGFHFPFSWGAGLSGFSYTQEYATRQLFLQNDKIKARSDSITHDIHTEEHQILFRPEIWVLPYLNLYGIVGYTEGNVNPEITANGIIVELPVGDTIVEVPIDTSISINKPMKYNGPVYGFGVTASYVFNQFFIELDYNYSEVHPKDMDGKLVSHRLSPKAGMMFISKNKNTKSAVWFGASWLENTQTLTGIVNVREFMGDLADYLGEEAEYTATLKPVNKWNMVVGGSLAINNHYNVALEAGFIGRKKISLGFMYRF